MEMRLESFTEVRGDGSRYEGAALHDPRRRSLFKQPDHLVTANEGVELRAWFGPVKLEELDLSLVLDLKNTQALCRALGQDMALTGSSAPLGELKFRTVLRAKPELLHKAAKRAPAGAPRETQLMHALRDLPEMLESLEPWELKAAQPLAE